MIIKSYEVKQKKSIFIKESFFLVYGENFGLKKDIRNFITKEIKENDSSIEILTLYENEVLNDEENFFNTIYSGSLFGNKKIISIFDGTDKIIKIINTVYEKCPDNISLLIFSGVLEKKSKLRNFFEKNESTICIACYLDNERDLEAIAKLELEKNKISLSREIINLLIEKSNFDRNNLRNEIQKIHSYSLDKKKLELDEIKLLINFSGDYKSDILINECLCGNVNQFKKIISELYTNTINQILLLRILSNKIQRLLKIKEQENVSNNLDNLINTSRPPIFWKEKPLIKKQLSLWNLNELKIIVKDINKTELLCKKNPQISNIIFTNFFSQICKKANSFS